MPCIKHFLGASRTVELPLTLHHQLHNPEQPARVLLPPLIFPGNADSKRQCCFLIVSQFFLLLKPLAPLRPRCCVGKVIQHHLTFRPRAPPPLHLSLPAFPWSTNTSGACSRVRACVPLIVFVCTEIMCYPVSDRPSSCLLGCKALVFCVHACRMSGLLSFLVCFYYREDDFLFFYFF